jgi:hypothetical protein
MKKKRTAVVTQPTYLPWLGYFDIIDQSSDFVFLDNVQFEKRSWQQRNRIRTPNGLEWLTVPVCVKGRFDQLIREAQIMESDIFPRGHLRAVELNYRRAPFFNKYYPGLHDVMVRFTRSLDRLNINLIQWLCDVLGIEFTFRTSSELKAEGKRSSLLTDVCEKVGAEFYLSTEGAKSYLMSDCEEFRRKGIQLSVHHYDHPRYKQLYRPFLPYATVIDLLFNEGDRSLEIIRSGRKEAFVLTA